jgi:hypothetical protein
MKVNIRDITACCRRCNGEEFEPLQAGDLRLASELKCSGCAARYTYLQLLDQIGEEALRRANQALDELKRKPPRE